MDTFYREKRVEEVEIGEEVGMIVRYCQNDFDEILYEDGAELGKGHTILFIARNMVEGVKIGDKTLYGNSLLPNIKSC